MHSYCTAQYELPCTATVLHSMGYRAQLLYCTVWVTVHSYCTAQYGLPCTATVLHSMGYRAQLLYCTVWVTVHSYCTAQYGLPCTATVLHSMGYRAQLLYFTAQYCTKQYEIPCIATVKQLACSKYVASYHSAIASYHSAIATYVLLQNQYMPHIAAGASRIGLLAVDKEVVKEEELPLLRVARRYLNQCPFLDEVRGRVSHIGTLEGRGGVGGWRNTPHNTNANCCKATSHPPTMHNILIIIIQFMCHKMGCHFMLYNILKGIAFTQLTHLDETCSPHH